MLRIATVWQLALGKMKEVFHMLASPVQGVSKCFLAKSPVGSLPLANLEMPHCSGRFRAPAQMRSRCVGRGDASRAVKPRGTQRRTNGLCGDESAVSTARDGVYD